MNFSLARIGDSQSCHTFDVWHAKLLRGEEFIGGILQRSYNEQIEGRTFETVHPILLPCIRYESADKACRTQRGIEKNERSNSLDDAVST